MNILHILRLAAILVPLITASSLSLAGEPGEGQESPTAGQPRIEPGNYDKLRVGDGDNGGAVVPTNQVVSPLGVQVGLRGRPTALAISPDRRWLGVLSHDRLLLVDLDAKTIRDSARHPGSFTGIVFAPDGKQLFASNVHGTVDAFVVDGAGKLKRSWSVRPKAHGKDESKNTVPAGLAVVSPAGLAVVSPGGHAGGRLWAVLNLGNTLAEIDLPSGRVLREIAVGNAPLDVACAAGKLYVSNWAGRRPERGDTTGPSGVAPPVRVDPRCHIAAEGSVSVVDPLRGQVIRELVVGPHACGMSATADGRFVCVACANADTVAVIDTRRDEIVETISTRPAPELLLGSAPNALVFDREGKTLYVSNGANNAVAVIDFDPPHSRLAGCLPAGWYPAGLVLDEKRQTLCVANVKGLGWRTTAAESGSHIKGKTVWGYNTLEPRGTVSLIPLPKREDLAGHTRTVLANNRLAEAQRAISRPRGDARPRPVPERHGEPSVFQHVIYIIKENRTYDQVFGDIPQGQGDPELCIFGQQVTPNQHRLARDFVLLDNFYCSGVLSADGHQWTDEAYVTDYIEKSFGGWPRSYPYDGNDAMAYARSGFLWDNVLAHGRTLRVYGEFVKPTIRWRDTARTPGPAFLDCYHDYLEKSDKIEIRGRATIRTLEPYLCPTAISFPLIVSDQYRADQFLRELRELDKRGEMPRLVVMSLPGDHTSGTKPGMPTPEAAVADNDLALGRIVEAVSHGRFWPSTCIFVVEDDPQNGFDHIDGHRTTALVVSPYTRRRAVDSTNYNQTSMVRTIELILGLPPMNQIDASATAMASCFVDQPDMTPYQAVKNNIPLDRVNRPLSEIADAGRRHWAEVSLRLPLDEADEADEDTLNRILWHSQRGRDDTYPSWAVLDAQDED
jgi:DNA-binding beta-propeller fold protein YncE